MDESGAAGPAANTPPAVLRADYLGVHQPVYDSIVQGSRAGWSTPKSAHGSLSQVLRSLGLPGAPQGGRLLELGCGDACLTVLLAKIAGFAVSGVELVPLAVELGMQRLAAAGETAELRQGDVLSLPWPDAAFDVVVDGSCLHCIVLGDRRRCLLETWRVLRPGGMFIVMTLAGDPPPALRDSFDPRSCCLVRDGVAGRYYGTPEGILAELVQAGFEPAAHWLLPGEDAAADSDELVVAARKPAL